MPSNDYPSLARDPKGKDGTGIIIIAEPEKMPLCVEDTPTYRFIEQGWFRHLVESCCEWMACCMLLNRFTGGQKLTASCKVSPKTERDTFASSDELNLAQSTATHPADPSDFSVHFVDFGQAVDFSDLSEVDLLILQIMKIINASQALEDDSLSIYTAMRNLGHGPNGQFKVPVHVLSETYREITSGILKSARQPSTIAVPESEQQTTSGCSEARRTITPHRPEETQSIIVWSNPVYPAGCNLRRI